MVQYTKHQAMLCIEPNIVFVPAVVRGPRSHPKGPKDYPLVHEVLDS